MRDLIDKFNKLLNETDYSHLKNKPKVPEILTESSMSRIVSLTEKYDCAILTAFRDKLINCLNAEDVVGELNIRDNKGRNKALKAYLLNKKYAITNVKGNYIENYVSEKQKELDAKSKEVVARPEPKEKSEDSFFVVNINNDPNFVDEIIKLGKLFCQDAVMIFEKDSGSKYL
jgi:methyltransferase-like protein